MKKWIIVFVIIICCCFISNEKQIRVRVVPNSNNEKDLIVKNKVQNKIEEILIDILEDKEEYEEIKEEINDNLVYISDELNEIENITVSFSNHNMGIKSYNDKVIGGSELTLLIVINEGKGDNWWGTLYPNLLGISTDEKVEYKFWFENLGG